MSRAAQARAPPTRPRSRPPLMSPARAAAVRLSHRSITRAYLLALRRPPSRALAGGGSARSSHRRARSLRVRRSVQRRHANSGSLLSRLSARPSCRCCPAADGVGGRQRPRPSLSLSLPLLVLLPAFRTQAMPARAQLQRAAEVARLFGELRQAPARGSGFGGAGSQTSEPPQRAPRLIALRRHYPAAAVEVSSALPSAQGRTLAGVAGRAVAAVAVLERRPRGTPFHALPGRAPSSEAWGWGGRAAGRHGLGDARWCGKGVCTHCLMCVMTMVVRV